MVILHVIPTLFQGCPGRDLGGLPFFHGPARPRAALGPLVSPRRLPRRRA